MDKPKKLTGNLGKQDVSYPQPVKEIIKEVVKVVRECPPEEKNPSHQPPAEPTDRTSFIGKILPPVGKSPQFENAGGVLARGNLFQKWRDVWNIHPSTIIDGGAASGEWTKNVMGVFPDAKILVVDPLDEQMRNLKRLEDSNPRIRYEHSALGAKQGTIKFYATKETDSSYIRQENDGIVDNRGEFREVPIQSIKDLVKKHNLQAPYLIKLDTHGFELPILEGAEEILGQTQLLMIEVYGIRIQPHSPLFWEVCAWLDKRGFQLVDIYEVIHRAGDGAFWQADAIFLPKTHFVPEKKTYH